MNDLDRQAAGSLRERMEMARRHLMESSKVFYAHTDVRQCRREEMDAIALAVGMALGVISSYLEPEGSAALPDEAAEQKASE